MDIIINNILKPTSGKKKMYSYSTLEIEHHRDIAIISIVSSIFMVVLKEGTKNSIYEDSRKVFYDSGDESIDKLRHGLFKYFKEFKNYEISQKKRDSISINVFKKKANDIYSNTVCRKRFSKDFSLEIFAMDILIARFVDRRGFENIKRTPLSSIKKFVSHEIYNLISNALVKYLKTDDFKMEYLAARLVVHGITKL